MLVLDVAGTRSVASVKNLEGRGPSRPSAAAHAFSEATSGHDRAWPSRLVRRVPCAVLPAGVPLLACPAVLVPRVYSGLIVGYGGTQSVASAKNIGGPWSLPAFVNWRDAVPRVRRQPFTLSPKQKGGHDGAWPSNVLVLW